MKTKDNGATWFFPESVISQLPQDFLIGGFLMQVLYELIKYSLSIICKAHQNAVRLLFFAKY